MVSLVENISFNYLFTTFNYPQREISDIDATLSDTSHSPPPINYSQSFAC